MYVPFRSRHPKMAMMMSTIWCLTKQFICLFVEPKYQLRRHPLPSISSDIEPHFFRSSVRNFIFRHCEPLITSFFDCRFKELWYNFVAPGKQNISTPFLVIGILGSPHQQLMTIVSKISMFSPNSMQWSDFRIVKQMNRSDTVVTHMILCTL